MPVRATTSACLFGLVYFAFFLPITGVAPIERAYGKTEYHLIDRSSDARWVLRFPTNQTVEIPEKEHSLWPSVGGRRPLASPNQRMTVSVSRDNIAVGSGDTPFVDVRLRSGHQSRHRSFGTHHRERCSRGQEIAPNVFAMVDVPRSEAELSYELGSQSDAFEDYYAKRFADKCVRPDGPFAGRYVVTSPTGQTIGYGNCFFRNTSCRFSFDNPFKQPVYYDLQAEDVDEIAAIHEGVVRFLVEATDRESSTGLSFPDPKAVEQDPIGMAEYVLSPIFSTTEIGLESVPSDGFRQVIFDRTSPNVVTRETDVSRIAINSDRRGFSGLAVDHIAAYWVGKRTFAKPTRQMISLDVSQAHAVVRINGQIVFSSSPRKITGKDIQNALNNPVYKSGDVTLGFVPAGPRPENPFVFDFPAGDSIIEVDYINEYHTAEFMFTIGNERLPLSRNAARGRLAAANLQDTDVYYVGVYQSSRPDGRITLRLPDTTRPAVLILDSFGGVTWEIESDRKIVNTIVSSASPAVQLTGSEFGDLIHLNSPFRSHDETRDCDCERGRFRCGSKNDVVDIANVVEDLTGVPLSGYAMGHEIGLMSITDYTPSLEERIKQLRIEDAALQQTCG